MKMIVAIIRPEMLYVVQEALDKQNIHLMTVSDVRGCGTQRGHVEVYRGQEIQSRLLPKIKLEIAVNEEFVEPALQAITKAAKSNSEGKIGDGKIFVLDLSECVRIRTEERGKNAIGP